MATILNSIWILPLIVTIHNIEEAIFMPNWLVNKNPTVGKRILKEHFWFAVSIVTLIAYLISLLYYLLNNNQLIMYLYYGFIGAMILNAIVPHLIATVYYKKYNPGVFTGTLLNIPVFSYVLIGAINNKIINVKELIIVTLILGLSMILLISLLFKIAKRLFK